jgi:hypothetical protein
VPLDFAAIIGDAIHNLRTSLDLLACELVRANGQSDKDVHFPFAESAAELPVAIRKRFMHRAKPDVVALIEKVQPYTGGNHSLRAIHDLDIMDMIGAPDVPGYETPPNHRFGPITDGVGLATLGDHARLPIGMRAQGKFNLGFGFAPNGVFAVKFQPLRGSEVIPALISLANQVESLIEAFILVA